ncbi:MAG: hypothetical protein LH473_11325, partial [Chitinophagales bacterium]|nr:hypothetical protein [Chitinophagales bacterium]
EKISLPRTSMSLKVIDCCFTSVTSIVIFPSLGFGKTDKQHSIFSVGKIPVPNPAVVFTIQ